MIPIARLVLKILAELSISVLGTLDFYLEGNTLNFQRGGHVKWPSKQLDILVIFSETKLSAHQRENVRLGKKVILKDVKC